MSRETTDPPETTDPAWSCFAQSILELGPRVPEAADVRVDLRRVLTARERAELARVAGSDRFAVVTPYNPRGDRLDEPENAARWRRMRAELEGNGIRSVRADGVSPDGGHREPGFALPLSREAAVALATRWEQIAIFWFDGEAVWILPARSGHPPVRLPLPGAGA